MMPKARALRARAHRTALSSTMRAAATCALAVCCATACAGSRGNKLGPERLPPDEPWRATRPAAGPMPEFKLPTIAQLELKNGMRIYVVEEHSLPTVVMGFVARAGSAHEPIKEAGLARLAWELLDEGAGSMDDVGLATAFGNLGTRLELRPGNDASALHAALLKKHLDAGLELVSTVVRKPTFAAADIERVRSQLIDELRSQEGDPAAVADVLARALVFGADHPYGHQVTGTTAALEKLTAARVKKFWTESVGPRNSALVMAGDVTVEEAKALAEKHFGKWSGGPKAIKAPADPKPIGGFKLAFVDIPGAQQTAIRLGRAVLARGDPEEAALVVFNAIMGGQFSSRLNLKLREEKQWTYGCLTDTEPMHGKGAWGIVSCEVQTAATADAVVEILAILDPPTMSTISDDEIARAKDGWTRSLPGILGLPDVQVAATAQLFASDLAADHYGALANAVGAVDAAAVQRVANRALVKDDRVLVLVGDRATVQPLLEQKGFTGITYFSAPGVELKN